MFAGNLMGKSGHQQQQGEEQTQRHQRKQKTNKTRSNETMDPWLFLT